MGNEISTADLKALKSMTTEQKMTAMRDRLFREFEDAKRQLRDQYTVEFTRMRTEYRSALESTKQYHKDEIEKLKRTLLRQREAHEVDKQRCVQQLTSRRRMSQDVSVCRSCLLNKDNEKDNTVTSGQIKEVIDEYERQLALCRKTINEQKIAYEESLATEKQVLQDAFMDEKVEFEEMAFRQLNLKLEKELKWRDLLLLEQGMLSSASSKLERDSGTELDDERLRITSSSSSSTINTEDQEPDADFSTLRQSMLDSFEAEKQHIENNHKAAIEELKTNLSRESQRTVMRERKIHKRTIEQLKIDFQLLLDENKKLKELLKEQDSEYSNMSTMVSFTNELKQQMESLQLILSNGEEQGSS